MSAVLGLGECYWLNSSNGEILTVKKTVMAIALILHPIFLSFSSVYHGLM